MASPLMRKAVAVWLVDKTALTFEQIAQACGLHVLEVEGIADGTVAHGLIGCDPRITGEVEQADIEACENDPNRKLSIKSIVDKRKRKGRAYTPVVKRRVKSDAALWLINKYPELSDAQIVSLIGTTAKIVKSIRDRTYWNYENLKPRDPILFNLYSQEDLDEALLKVKISEQSEQRLREIEESMQDSI
ncbi:MULTISPECIES: DUF1013 domain-containing protein [Neorickettsia]|uniref:DUF1013 domain-containing protein n=1 Tax=Neorickettsia findlayensis TaxID=2686014 RepID=A0A6P1G9W2_9RICK|nr:MULTISPECIES: DUF1013 domain-containing protein [Neorickettsia]QHD65226.1 DUF1013 domain-containing protein [Neorickettsia findlayensis]